MLKIVGLFLWGLISQQFSKKAFGTMLKYLRISGAIRKHYKKLPENPKNSKEWVEKAEELWNPVEKMRFTLTL